MPNSMNCFHLLRLPTVALIEVLKCLNPIELYQISQCSRRISKLFHLAGTKQFSLEMNFGESAIIINEDYAFEFCNDSTERYKDPTALVFYFPNDSHPEMADRVKLRGYSVSALFKCPIKSVKFGYTTSSGQSRSLFEEIISTQEKPLENLKLVGKFENEDLKWILENANITGRLEIWMNELQHFPIDLKLSCRQFFIHPAFWITVDNLLSLKSCVTIDLFKASLTYRDLDVFMENWKSGMFPNLECLNVHSKVLKNDGRIMGFSKEQLRAPKRSSKRKMIGDGCYGTSTRGVDVVNDDGMKGSIQMGDRNFEFFVWKD